MSCSSSPRSVVIVTVRRSAASGLRLAAWWSSANRSGSPTRNWRERLKAVWPLSTPAKAAGIGKASPEPQRVPFKAAPVEASGSRWKSATEAEGAGTSTSTSTRLLSRVARPLPPSQDRVAILESVRAGAAALTGVMPAALA